jgi:hypothetical protein
LVAFSNKPGDYFIARFLGYRSYWTGVATQLSGDFGLVLLAAMVVALVVARGRLRLLLWASVVAYAAFAIAFDYRVATHSYYSLPAFVAVSLGTAEAVEAIARWVASRGFSSLAKRGAAVVVVALALIVALTDIRSYDIKPALAEIARARAIGPLVCHSTKTLMITPVYGTLERYYGDIAGSSWPTFADQRLSVLQGQQQPTAAVRLEQYRNAGYRWVILTDASVTAEQPALAPALASYPVAFRGSGWRVYDLDPRQPRGCGNAS